MKKKNYTSYLSEEIEIGRGMTFADFVYKAVKGRPCKEKKKKIFYTLEYSIPFSTFFWGLDKKNLKKYNFPMKKVKIIFLSCLHCSHRWQPRTKIVRRCPKCHSNNIK